MVHIFKTCTYSVIPREPENGLQRCWFRLFLPKVNDLCLVLCLYPYAWGPKSSSPGAGLNTEDMVPGCGGEKRPRWSWIFPALTANKSFTHWHLAKILRSFHSETKSQDHLANKQNLLFKYRDDMYDWIPHAYGPVTTSNPDLVARLHQTWRHHIPRLNAMQLCMPLTDIKATLGWTSTTIYQLPCYFSGRQHLAT